MSFPSPSTAAPGPAADLILEGVTMVTREITNSMIVDMDDVNYSVLTYAASEKKNAMGPSLQISKRKSILIKAHIQKSGKLETT